MKSSRGSSPNRVERGAGCERDLRVQPGYAMFCEGNYEIVLPRGLLIPSLAACRPLARRLPAGSSASSFSRPLPPLEHFMLSRLPAAIPKPSRQRRARTSFDRVTVVTLLCTTGNFYGLCDQGDSPASMVKAFDTDRRPSGLAAIERTWPPKITTSTDCAHVHETTSSSHLLLPSVTIQCTESMFKEQNIEVLTKTMVQEVKDKTVVVKNDEGQIEELPYGLFVWAAGNVSGPITRDLMAQLPQYQTNRRGSVGGCLFGALGVNDVCAIGDCSAMSYVAAAHVATQQGLCLALLLGHLKKEELEKKLLDLRGESSGLPEGPEERRRENRIHREAAHKALPALRLAWRLYFLPLA